MSAVTGRVLRMNFAKPVSSLVGALLALLTGCIPIPIPASKARFTETQLASVGKDANTHDEVRARLGAPDMDVLYGRAWIYAWEIGHGRIFAIPILPLAAGPMASSTEQFVLVLEFGRNGNLQSKVFAAQDLGAVDDRYCTAGGMCIQHKVQVGYDLNGAVIGEFRKNDSAVIVRDPAKEGFPGPTLLYGQCLLTIWPESEWDLGIIAPHGITINVVPGRSDHGHPSEQYVERVHWWLPTRSYAQFALKGGDYYVVGDGAADFSCPAGSEIYLSIGRGAEDGHGHSMVLHPVEEDKAKTIIAGMFRLILE